MYPAPPHLVPPSPMQNLVQHPEFVAAIQQLMARHTGHGGVGRPQGPPLRPPLGRFGPAGRAPILPPVSGYHPGAGAPAGYGGVYSGLGGYGA